MNTKRGVISTIILIMVALIILGYYNVSLRSLVESPIIRDNLHYAWSLFVEGVKTGWQVILDALRQVSTAVQK